MIQLLFDHIYFCPLGFYNTLSERCVLFLTRQVAMLRVELLNQDKKQYIHARSARGRERGMEGR